MKNPSVLRWVGFFILLPLCVFSQENIYLQKGIAAFSNEEYASAQYHLKKAVETTNGPEKYESLIYLGASYLLDGKEQLARKYFGRAIQLYPLQLPDNFAVPGQVVQFYRKVWEIYPVVKSVSFTDFNPYQFKENMITIQPEILHAEYLQDLQLRLLKNGSEITTLEGLSAIQHWNGMSGDSPIASGKYQMRFILKTNRQEEYQQEFPVQITATSPYGDRLQQPEEVKGLKDNSSGAMGLIWLGSMVFVAGNSMKNGTPVGQAIAQGLLLGSLLALPIMYVVGAAVGVGDDAHNQKIIRQVRERNREIEERNRKLKETFTIHIQLLE